MKWFLVIYTVVLGSVMLNGENLSAKVQGDSSQISETDNNVTMQVEEEVARKIYAIIEHFKQDDPIGLPDGLLPVPDPAPVPDIAQSISMANLKMTNVQLFGISKFRIKYVMTEVKEMKAKMLIEFDSLVMKGNYQLSSFMSRSKGPATIVLKEVKVNGEADLGVERDGKLRTQKIDIDIQFKEMSMDFQNLGFFASVFQSIANSASNVIFDSIKPLLLKDAHAKIKSTVNDNLVTALGDNQIPNSLSPIDFALAECRKLVRAKNFDPFQVEDYNHPGVIGVKIFNTWLHGISSFYRLGDMSLSINNNSAVITLTIGTQELSGSSTWQVSIAKGMITRSGNIQFTVQHIKVNFTITQPLNLSKKLQIDDLQLDLGNIQIRSNGLGTADYLLEFFVNILPNLLRYQIVDALEKPLARRIQEYTDRIDLEKITKELVEEYRTTGTIDLANIKLEL